MHFASAADAVRQREGERSSEVLAELLQSDQDLQFSLAVSSAQQVGPDRQPAPGQGVDDSQELRLGNQRALHRAVGVQRDADRHRLAVAHRPAAHDLQPVGRPVTEVQRTGRAELERIAAGGNVLQVQQGAAADGLGHHGLIAGGEVGGVVCKKLEQGRILDDRDLERLGRAGDPVALRQRSQEVPVVQHGERRGERTDEVLLPVLVHAVLHADPRVVLCQGGRRQADDPQPAMHDRGGEPQHVQHAAAPDGQDVALAIQPQVCDLRHHVANDRPAGLGLGPAGHDPGVRGQDQPVAVGVEILADPRAKARSRRRNAAVDIDGRAMTPALAQPVHHLRQQRVVLAETPSREMHRVVEPDRKTLVVDLVGHVLRLRAGAVMLGFVHASFSSHLPTFAASPTRSTHRAGIGSVVAQATSRPGPVRPCVPAIRSGFWQTLIGGQPNSNSHGSKPGLLWMSTCPA